MIRLTLSLFLISGALAQTQGRTALQQHEPEAPPSVAGFIELYDVARLTGHDRWRATVREIEVGGAQAIPGPGGEPWRPAAALELLEQRRERSEQALGSLLDTLRERMEPAYSADANRLQPLENGRIAFLGETAQHRWLTGFLNRAGAFSGVIRFEARIYQFPGRLPAVAGLGLPASFLGPAQTELLIQQLDETEAELVQSPAVIAFPFQSAELSSLEKVSYVKDYELKVIPEAGLEVLDPVIGTIENGLLMRLRAVPLEQGSLGVSMHLEHASLHRPMEIFELSLGHPPTPVSIQLPKVTWIEVGGDFDVGPGQTLLLQSDEPEGSRQILVLLSVSRVEEF